MERKPQHKNEPLERNIDWDRAAKYYDAFVQTTFDVPFILEQARRTRGPLLELMCGTGRLTLPIAKTGLQVTALDSSRGLLSILRRKLQKTELPIEIVEADVRRFALDRKYPFVLIGFHAFAELLGERARQQAFASIREHIAERGRFLLTLHNPPVRAAAVHSQWRVMGLCDLKAGVKLEVSSRWELDRAKTRVTGAQHYREIDNNGKTITELTLPITFDLVAPDEVYALAEMTGFAVSEVYGNYDGASFEPSTSPCALFLLQAC